MAIPRSIPTFAFAGLPLTKPAPPSNLTAVATGHTIRLNWDDNSSNELGFRIQRSPDGIAWTYLNTVGAGIRTYQDGGLADATTYYYRVKAYNRAGSSAWSNTASDTTGAGPQIGAPTLLALLVVSSTQINLTWQDNASNEAGYSIERDGVEVGTVAANATTFSATGLIASTSYDFRVRAFNGSVFSAYTATESAITQAAPVPTAPTALAATAISDTQINLAWVDSTGETSYSLERRTTIGPGSWAVIATPAANATSYNNTTGLSANTSYDYRIAAVNGSGPSAYSNIATGKTAVSPIPADPSVCNATTVSSSRIDVTWTDNSSNETGFQVWRKTGGGSYSQIATVGAGVVTFSNTGLTASTLYTYKIRAFNGAVLSNAYSNEDADTTSANSGLNPNAVITASATTVMAGVAVHVHATNSALVSGQWHEATVEWDMGAPSDDYNSERGFNLSHVYDTAGPYTITLTVTNVLGNSGSTTLNITVTPDTRTKIYVSAAGNDANNGTSTGTPVRTIARAVVLTTTNNSAIYSRRGDIFDVGHIYLPRKNLVWGAYGSGNRPVFRAVAGAGTAEYDIFGLDAVLNEDVTFEDLAFDSDRGPVGTTYPDNGILAFQGRGKNITVRRCSYSLNVTHGFIRSETMNMSMSQDNTAPAGVRGKMDGPSGNDCVVLGEICADSTRSHCIRGHGTRHNWQYNVLTQLEGGAGDPANDNLNTIRPEEGSFFYIGNNRCTGGEGVFGPLGNVIQPGSVPQGNTTSGAAAMAERTTYIIVENNRFYSTQVTVRHGILHATFRNNIFSGNVTGNAFALEGHSTEFNREIVDARFINNTVEATGSAARCFAKLYAPLFGTGTAKATDLQFLSNLMYGPLMSFDPSSGYLTMIAGPITDSVLRSANNIVSVSATYLNRESHIAAVDITRAAWAALSIVTNDIFASVAPTTTYQATSGGTTSGSSLARP